MLALHGWAATASCNTLENGCRGVYMWNSIFYYLCYFQAKPAKPKDTEMIETTLEKIKSQNPCSRGWKKLLTGLGKKEADNTTVTIRQIIDICGIDDALWCLRCWPEHGGVWRKLAVDYARTVQHLMTDPRALNALEVAERYAVGLAIKEDLEVAWKDSLSVPKCDIHSWDYNEKARNSSNIAATHTVDAKSSETAWYAMRDAIRATEWDAYAKDSDVQDVHRTTLNSATQMLLEAVSNLTITKEKI